MRRAVEPFRERCDDATHPLGNGRVIGVGQVEAGGLVKKCGQMAEHVAGTAVVVMRVLAAAFGGAPGAKVILSERNEVMTLLCRPCARLPAKTGRKQGRQQDCKQGRGDIA